MKILIVDDNARVRWLIKTMIQDLATEFYECDDGIKALEAYSALQPDWVLMDIKMEQMDGIDATKRIKTVFAQAKIIIVTDYNDASLRDAALMAGAYGYVIKEDLHLLRNILQSRSTSHET
ncbi:MAG TPA: response regulator transcription factor [Blastocatellia bacterium]|nr:response regulator transcription factor [Blastocatellia bacterium]